MSPVPEMDGILYPTIPKEKQDVLGHIGVELPVQHGLQSLLGL